MKLSKCENCGCTLPSREVKLDGEGRLREIIFDHARRVAECHDMGENYSDIVCDMALLIRTLDNWHKED
jgi:hypothetical protein